MMAEVICIIYQQYIIGSTCTIETGWICENGTASSADTCTEDCGDSIIINNEVWDDGNNNSNDGWSSDWLSLESGFTCINNSNGFTEWSTTCGDGYRVGN